MGNSNPSTVSQIINYDSNTDSLVFVSWVVDDWVTWSVNGEIVLVDNNISEQYELLNLTEFLTPGANTISATLTKLHSCFGLFCLIYEIPSTPSIDCAGVLNGSAAIDLCGVCSGGTTGIATNACVDCGCTKWNRN